VVDGTEFIMVNNAGDNTITASDNVRLTSSTGTIVLRSAVGVDIKDIDTNKFTKLEQSGDNLSITNANADGYITLDAPNVVLRADSLTTRNTTDTINYELRPNQQPPGDNQTLQWQSNGQVSWIPTPVSGNPASLINTDYLNDAPTGSIFIFNGNNGTDGNPSSLLTADSTNLNLTATPQPTLNLLRTGSPSGGSLFIDANNDLQLVNNTDGNSKLITNGTMTITGSNAIQLQSQYDIQFTTGAGVGCSFNGIGSLNSSGSELVLNNADGNLLLSSKFNDVIIDTEGGGKLQVNQGSEFQGDMTISKVDPKLNFNNTDYPTQLCNIAFESATQELIMEHNSPDLASKCNIRLGTNDINIQSTFSALTAGNINLETGAGYTFINQYKLPNVNPTADGQLLSANIDGTSSWIDIPPASIPQNTYTYWVSNQGLDTNNGSIINPFQTIAHSLTVANALADTIPVVINVLAGTYVENLTITRTNMTIIGSSATSPNLTVINGTVSFSIVSSNAITNPQVGSISNFIFFNTVSQANTTLSQNTLLINNCVLFPTSAIIPLQTSNAGGSVQKPDMTVSNSFIYIFNQPVTIDSTGIFLVNTQVTNSPLFSSTSSFFNVIGSGRWNAFGSILRNTNTSAQVGPLVLIANSVDSTSDSTVNATSFIYNSSTLDTGFGGKCGIRFANAGSCQTYIVTNSFFKCLGATTTTGSSNQFLIIQRTGAGQCSLAIGNNPCQGLNTHHVPNSGSGFTKIILVNAL
jgi:hypothetical protein